jgi:hypothetical protein
MNVAVEIFKAACDRLQSPQDILRLTCLAHAAPLLQTPDAPAVTAGQSAYTRTDRMHRCHALYV